MKCLRCKNDTYGSHRICDACLSDYDKRRKLIWEHNEHNYGKLDKDNLAFYQKETKRLERLFKKNQAEFINETDLLTKNYEG